MWIEKTFLSRSCPQTLEVLSCCNAIFECLNQFDSVPVPARNECFDTCRAYLFVQATYHFCGVDVWLVLLLISIAVCLTSGMLQLMDI